MHFQRLSVLILAFLALALLSLAGTAAQPNELVDSDGDGIPDVIEINGIHDDNGHMLVDLKAMGADPHHKDLFVQCDYMEAHDHTHRPKPEALKKIIEAYEHAPVSNPDGKTGIHIHVDAGPESTMNPASGQPWGELSAAQAVPHADNIGTEDAEDNYDWNPVDQIKAATFPAARAPVFRYCLWAHDYAHSGSSGLARGLPGDDSLVTLGTFEGGEGTVLEQTGTFMHEFGHTLGFRHGGSDDENHKPNFFSIMSYNYQFEGLRVHGLDGVFDYSRQAVPALNEGALGDGLPGAPSGYSVRWYLVHGEESADCVADSPAHIDWSQSGEHVTRLDVNGDGQITVLAGTPDEWHALHYTGQAVGDYAGVPLPNGKKPPPHKPNAGPRYTHAREHLTRKDAERLHLDYDVSTVMSEDLAGAPGATVTFHVTVTNEGTKDDTYRITSEHAAAWADVTRLPKKVAIPAAQSRKFDIPVHIAAGAKQHEKETILIEALSEANPNIVDEAEVYVTAVH